MDKSGSITSVAVSVPDDELMTMLNLTRADSDSSAILQLARTGLSVMERMLSNIENGGLDKESLPKRRPGADGKRHITRSEYDAWIKNSFLMGLKMTQEESELFWVYVVEHNFVNNRGMTMTLSNICTTMKSWLSIHRREGRMLNGSNASFSPDSSLSEEARFQWNRRLLSESDGNGI